MDDHNIVCYFITQSIPSKFKVRQRDISTRFSAFVFFLVSTSYGPLRQKLNFVRRDRDTGIVMDMDPEEMYVDGSENP